MSAGRSSTIGSASAEHLAMSPRCATPCWRACMRGGACITDAKSAYLHAHRRVCVAVCPVGKANAPWIISLGRSTLYDLSHGSQTPLCPLMMTSLSKVGCRFCVDFVIYVPLLFRTWSYFWQAQCCDRCLRWPRRRMCWLGNCCNEGMQNGLSCHSGVLVCYHHPRQGCNARVRISYSLYCKRHSPVVCMQALNQANADSAPQHHSRVLLRGVWV